MKLFKILLLLISISCMSFTIDRNDIEKSFKNPPHNAKPKTWMHAMSANMSEEGLTKDLESIADVGIGGILLFNIAQGIPNGPIKYNSDEHHKMIRHAAKECERLGLSFGVHNCDGWSSSGGPWIKPEHSMKMVVWSDTVVDGGKGINLQLKQPSTREGFYKDIAVIAYPSLDAEVTDAEVKPEITASDKGLNIALITDNRIDARSTLKKNKSENPWIQFDYKKPQTIRSVYIAHHDKDPQIDILYSNDGVKFIKIKTLDKTRPGKSEYCHLDNFDPVTARYFRLVSNMTINIQEVKLTAIQQITNYVSRTGIGRMYDDQLQPIKEVDYSMAIDSKNIINISQHMDDSGLLKFDLPEGKWTIMRFGQTATGAVNHPASEEGRGLECDKFSREAFKLHYDSFVKRVIDNAKEIAPNALQYIEIDSYEMGGQNWTDNFESIFAKSKGYEITKFLPLFAGKYIDNARTSDAVLWDLREFCCSLMTENYFGYFTELCHKDGLKSYIEPYGNGPVNSIDVGGKADMVMGEFWMNKSSNGTLASAVSSGHVYGKDIISAESFTSFPEINWKGHPGIAKSSGDMAWIHGINEFMFHRYAHQANTHVKPGMTMNRWGFHFDRTQTWWNNAGKDWFRYIARGSYMLRQGVPVSDVLIFVGDGTPNGVVSSDMFNGIKYDCVNADVLINRIQIKDKQLVLPEGTSYRVLILRNTDRINLNTLQKIADIAKAGIPIVGSKPKQIAGYKALAENDSNFKRIVAEIFSQPSTYENVKSNSDDILAKVGIVNDFMIDGSPSNLFIHRRINKTDTDIYFICNPDSTVSTKQYKFRINGKLPELWNPMTGEVNKTCQFEYENKFTNLTIKLQPQESMFIVFRENSNGITTVKNTSENLDIEYSLAHDNKIVMTATKNGVYNTKLSNGNNIYSTIEGIPYDLNIEGSWSVKFLKEYDYDTTVVFNTLTDWKDNTTDNIKYYSGTAIYRHSINISGNMLKPGIKSILDLGQVFVAAEIIVNGCNLGMSWMYPYTVDISNSLRVGNNDIEIRVTNQWSNRLIGDEMFPDQSGGYKLDGARPTGKMPQWYINNEPMPEGPRTTFCTGQFYKKGDPLMPSGLLGPVKIKFKKTIILN